MTITAERAEPAGRITDPGTGERHYEHPETGELLDSVTTVIDGTTFKPWIPGWYGRTTAEWMVDHLEAVARAKVLQGRQAAIDLGKDEGERRRNVKRDTGTYIHDIVEALILWAASPGRTGSQVALPDMPEHLEQALYDGDPVPDVADFMVTGFINWVSDFDPRFLAAEMQVYNRSLGVAGTLDIIAELAGYWLSADASRAVPMPGRALIPCVDVKSGRDLSGVRKQLAAYRRMTECRLPLGEVRPMPQTDCGAVLHLRAEYPDGYLFMLVSAGEDEEAWEMFRAAARVYRDNQAVKGKPGKSIRALRPDGTMPGPRICDLAGEGWGRALAPLARSLGSDAELEDVARFTRDELLAVKGIGPKLAADIRLMLIDHGLVREVA